jgi:hypothetical protein
MTAPPIQLGDSCGESNVVLVGKGLRKCPFRPVSFVDSLKGGSGDFRITDPRRILHHEHQNRKTN